MGRSEAFLAEIDKHRNQREPAQHVLGPSHVGAYARRIEPLRQGPNEKTPGSGGRG
jgi:hypothetical protein